MEYDGIEWNKSVHKYLWAKVNGSKWSLHRYVWHKESKIPLLDGFVIHHLDGDKENNNFSNLVQWTNWYHSKWHGDNMPDERKKKISDGHKGKVLSDDHRKKLSEAGKGRVFSDEHRKNLSKSQKGKVLSEETRKKKSESMKLYYAKRRKSIADCNEYGEKIE